MKILKKISWVQVCWLFISILLLFGCIYEIIHNNDNIFSLARPLGAVMFLTGVVHLFICYMKSYCIHGSRWLVADGLTALLLSFFPLFNQIIYPVMIPFFFGFWELFSGILKVMDSKELKDENIKCWVGFAVIGYIELFSGTFSMIKPIDEAVGVNSIIGIIFLIQSIGFSLKSIMYKYKSYYTFV